MGFSTRFCASFVVPSLLVPRFGVFIMIGVPSFPCVEAFADYLLTGSGCWTDLSPEEIIMNHAVVPAAETGDNLRLQVVGFSANEQNQVVLPSFPQTVQLQVTEGDRRVVTGDYQFAIDVVSLSDHEEAEPIKAIVAEFPTGSCDGKKRAAGRGRDKVKLLVHEAGAQIVAGWASGHEAVRLTPTVTFVSSDATGQSASLRSASLDKYPSERAPDWSTALMDNCPEVVHAENLGHYVIEHSPGELKASLLGDNQIQFQWPSSSLTDQPRHLVLVSTSTDATFPSGVCGGVKAPPEAGPRVVVMAEKDGALSLPVLSIHQPHTVEVYAFYASSRDANVIHRTDPFLLKWVNDPPNPQKNRPAPPNVTALLGVDPPHANSHPQQDSDPQRKVDAKARADPQALQDQALAYQKKHRPNDVHLGEPSEDEEEEESHAVSQEHEVSEHDDGEEEGGKQRGGPGSEAAGHHTKHLPPRRNVEEKHHVARSRPFAEPLHHHKQQTGLHDRDWQQIEFTLGWPYVAGVVILVVAPVVVVSLCLKVSRKSKGRRTL